jgi:tetratricopeptide (TPR) repeat protein
VERRFSVPSLFEKACPHFVPAYMRFYQDGQTALLGGQTEEALTAFEASLSRQPTFDAALSAWTQIRLAGGAPGLVIHRLDSLQQTVETPGVTILSPLLAVQLGDAYGMVGDAGASRRSYDAALARLPLFAHNERALIELRKLLADRPDALFVLVSRTAPQEKARALARLPDTPGAAIDYRAYLQAQAGAYRVADSLLALAVPPETLGLSASADTTLHLQRTAWRAQWAFLLEQYETAGARAHEAAQAYRRWGALNEAQLLDDLAERARWAGSGRGTFSRVELP